MKHSLLTATRVALALGVALSIGATSVAAATPSSSIKALPDRTSTRTATVSYVTSGDGGEISKVDLYAKKDSGSFVLVATSYDVNTPFLVDFGNLGGDGRYAFHTVAYLKNATETTADDVAEVGKDTLEETATIVDTVTPPAPDSSHIYINQAASLRVNEISGYARAVEGSATVNVYANPELTGLITTVTATADGSFGPTEIGTIAEHPYLWLVAIDANGNRSVATMVTNQLSYGATVTDLKVTAVSDTQLDVSYVAPTNVTEYVVYYRHAGGAVWSAMVRVKTTMVSLTGLEAGRAYDVRVAPVDANDSVGTYTFSSARTSGTPLKDVVLAGEQPKPVAVTEATTTATTAATATDQSAAATTTTKPAAPADTAPAVTTPTPTPDQTATPAADATSATNDNQPSSATPWVILAILIILAGIATGGYFYWFSGPEEVTTSVTEADTIKKEKTEEKNEEDVDKRW